MLSHYKGQQAVERGFRFLFQCFQAIHVFDLGKGMQVSNLNEERLLLIA